MGEESTRIQDKRLKCVIFVSRSCYDCNRALEFFQSPFFFLSPGGAYVIKYTLRHAHTNINRELTVLYLFVSLAIRQRFLSFSAHSDSFSRMSSSEDDIPLAARSKPKASLNKGMSSKIHITIQGARNLVTKDKTISKGANGFVDGKVDASGASKRSSKPTPSKAVNSAAATKQKRIVDSDDESDDDVPLV